MAGIQEQHFSGDRLQSLRALARFLAAVVPFLAATAAIGAAEPEAQAGPKLIDVHSYGFDADLDADRQPDFWARTYDTSHPYYVTAELDFTAFQAGKGSLKITGDGACAEFLGPSIPLEGSAAYDISGYVKTDSLPTGGLRRSHAYVEARLYDKDGGTLGSARCFPEVSGTVDWQRVWATDASIGQPAARSLRVAVGLEGLSLTGSAWFDSIEVRKRPVASLTTNRAGNCFFLSDKKTVLFEARGLPAGQYILTLAVKDRAGGARHEVSLEAAAESDGRLSVTYVLPALERGPYTVEVELLRDETRLLAQMVRLGVLGDFVTGETSKNFGISLSVIPELESDEYGLTDISGVGWVKVPLVEASTEDKRKYLRVVSELRRIGITPVGVLTVRGSHDAEAGEPGSVMRPNLLASIAKGSGAWLPAFSETINTFAGGVQWWQVGDDMETGLVRSPNASEAIGEIEDFTKEVSYQARLGIPIETPADLRLLGGRSVHFVSVDALRLAAIPNPELPRADVQSQLWSWVDPAGWVTGDADVAASRAVADIAANFAAGANMVFLRDPWTKRGILDGDGNVSPFALMLFNVISELGNYTYSGSISFLNRTPNAVFTSSDNTKVLLWPAAEPREETIFLGEAAELVDLYGNRSQAPVEGGENVIFVKSAPLILDRVDPAVVETRKTFAIEPDVIDSIYDVQPIYVIFTNKFPNLVFGDLSLSFPPGWEAQPNVFFVRLRPGETFRRRANLVVPYNALAGDQEISAALHLEDIGPRKITLVQHKQLSSLAFRMEIETRRSGPGVIVYQKVTNVSARAADASAFVEGEGLERVERLPRRLEPGTSVTFSYTLSDASYWEGRKLRASIREIKTNRFLNEEFIVSTAGQ